MATKSKKSVQEPAPEQAIENALGQTEQFFEKNGKSLLIGLAVVVVLVGGYFAYKYLVLAPRQERAAEAMFPAAQSFAAEQFDTALNGDGNNAGFLEVVEEYGSTPQGRLAAHYAAVCYLKAGDLDNALVYFKKYKPVKGVAAMVVNAQNYGLQGDVYVDKGDYAKAEEMFKKAVTAADNSLVTPYYLKKLGLVYMETGNKSAALEAFNRISEEFSASLEARDVDKYIGELEM